MKKLGKKAATSLVENLLPPLYVDSVILDRIDDKRFTFKIKSFIKERTSTAGNRASFFFVDEEGLTTRGDRQNAQLSTVQALGEIGNAESRENLMGVFASNSEVIKRVSDSINYMTIICTNAVADEQVLNYFVKNSDSFSDDVSISTGLSNLRTNYSGIEIDYGKIQSRYANTFRTKYIERDSEGQYYRFPVLSDIQKIFLNNQEHLSVYQFLFIDYSLSSDADITGFEPEDLKFLNQIKSKIEYVSVFKEGKLNTSSEIIVDRLGLPYLGTFVRASVPYLPSQYLKGSTFLGALDDEGKENYTQDDTLYVKPVMNTKIQDNRFHRRAQQDFIGRRNFGIGTEYKVNNPGSIVLMDQLSDGVPVSQREISNVPAPEPFGDETPFTDPRFESLVKKFPNFINTAREVLKREKLQKSKSSNIGLIVNHDKISGVVNLHITIDQQQILKNFSRLGYLWDKLPRFAHFSLLYPKRNLKLISVKLLRRRVYGEASQANEFGSPTRFYFDDKVKVVCEGGEQAIPGMDFKSKIRQSNLIDASWSDMSDGGVYGTLVQTIPPQVEQFEENRAGNTINDIDFPERRDQMFQAWTYSGTSFVSNLDPSSEQYVTPDGDETSLPLNNLGIPCFPFYRVLVARDETISRITDGVYQYGVELKYVDPMIEFFQVLYNMVQSGRRVIEDYYYESLIPAGGGSNFEAGPRASAIDSEVRKVTSLENGSYNHVTEKFTESFKNYVKRKYDSFIVPALNYAIASNVLFLNEEFKTQMQEFNSEFVSHDWRAQNLRVEGENHVSNTVDRFISLLNPDNTTPEQIGEILNSYFSLERGIEEIVGDNIVLNETTTDQELAGMKSKRNSIIEVEKWFKSEENQVSTSEIKDSIGSYFSSQGKGLVTNFPAISSDQLTERLQEELQKFGVTNTNAFEGPLSQQSPATLTFDTVKISLPGVSRDSDRFNRKIKSIEEQTLNIDAERLFRAALTGNDRSKNFDKIMAFLEFNGVNTSSIKNSRRVALDAGVAVGAAPTAQFLRSVEDATKQFIQSRKEKGEATFREIYDQPTLNQDEIAEAVDADSSLVLREANIDTISRIFCREKTEKTFDLLTLLGAITTDLKNQMEKRIAEKGPFGGGRYTSGRRFIKTRLDAYPMQIRIFMGLIQQTDGDFSQLEVGDLSRNITNNLTTNNFEQNINALAKFHGNRLDFKCINPAIFGNIGVIKKFVGFKETGTSGKKHTSSPIFRRVTMQQALDGLGVGLYKIEKYVNPTIGIVSDHNIPSREYFFEITENPLPPEERVRRLRVADLNRYRARSFSVVRAASNTAATGMSAYANTPTKVQVLHEGDEGFDGEADISDFIDSPKIDVGYLRFRNRFSTRTSVNLFDQFPNVPGAQQYSIEAARKGILSPLQLEALLDLSRRRNLIIEGSDRSRTIFEIARKANTSIDVAARNLNFDESQYTTFRDFIPLVSKGMLVYDGPLFGGATAASSNREDAVRRPGTPYYGPFVIHPELGFVNVKSYISYFEGGFDEGRDYNRADIDGQIAEGFRGPDVNRYRLRLWDPSRDTLSGIEQSLNLQRRFDDVANGAVFDVWIHQAAHMIMETVGSSLGISVDSTGEVKFKTSDMSRRKSIRELDNTELAIYEEQMTKLTLDSFRLMDSFQQYQNPNFQYRQYEIIPSTSQIEDRSYRRDESGQIVSTSSYRDVVKLFINSWVPNNNARGGIDRTNETIATSVLGPAGN